MELELGDENLDFVDEEVRQLQAIIDVLSPHLTDAKLDAVLYYLLERPDPWLPKGKWVGEALTQRIPDEPIAVYAGAGKSGMYISGEWKSVEREQIKKAVKDRTIRLVVATDAACEGLNLQTLGTLINIDLPWNPSRLEQRIGRIKRFGQRFDDEQLSAPTPERKQWDEDSYRLRELDGVLPRPSGKKRR
ncbi:C-terminal helicase domain-containing protein [Bradyrhizobium sp. USDA 10063]